jgi:acetylglutamate kinase
VNKRIVRVFQSCGIDAVGLSGSDGRIFTGKRIDAAFRTADVACVRSGLLDTLMGSGYLPVIASTSMEEESGNGLNINADSVALRLAAALESDSLIFISDIPGVMKEGRRLPVLEAEEAMSEIENGTITGGMIPKVRSSIEALEQGVERIIIGEYREEGDLRRLMDGETGTQILQSGIK